MKISIITVCLNKKEELEKTIRSVLIQDYNNLEYIIIDGNSNDGTNELIKEYQKLFPIIYLSEKDEGIYDAMNKGIDLSTGDWLNFMNAGDYFYSNETVKNILPYLDNSINIIYGNTEIRYEDFKVIKKEPAPNKLWMGRIPHQSAFINKGVMKKYMYNKDNKIVADLEFFMNVYYKNGKIIKINKVISSFAKNGITEKEGSRVINNAYHTVKKFKKEIIVDIYYNLLKIKPLIKRLLPRKIFKLIMSRI